VPLLIVGPKVVGEKPGYSAPLLWVEIREIRWERRPNGSGCRVTGVSTFLSVTITSLTRLRALHVDTSHATTLTGHDEEALNEQAATTQPGNVTNRPGKINAPVDRPGPHGWTFGYPSPWS